MCGRGREWVCVSVWERERVTEGESGCVGEGESGCV